MPPPTHTHSQTHAHGHNPVKLPPVLHHSKYIVGFEYNVEHKAIAKRGFNVLIYDIFSDGKTFLSYINSIGMHAV